MVSGVRRIVLPNRINFTRAMVRLILRRIEPSQPPKQTLSFRYSRNGLRMRGGFPKLTANSSRT